MDEPRQLIYVEPGDASRLPLFSRAPRSGRNVQPATSSGGVSHLTRNRRPLFHVEVRAVRRGSEVKLVRRKIALMSAILLVVGIVYTLAGLSFQRPLLTAFSNQLSRVTGVTVDIGDMVFTGPGQVRLKNIQVKDGPTAREAVVRYSVIDFVFGRADRLRAIKQVGIVGADARLRHDPNTGWHLKGLPNLSAAGDPGYSGSVVLRDARLTIEYAGQTYAIDKVHASLRVLPDQVYVDRLTGIVHGSLVTLNGVLSLREDESSVFDLAWDSVNLGILHPALEPLLATSVIARVEHSRTTEIRQVTARILGGELTAQMSLSGSEGSGTVSLSGLEGVGGVLDSLEAQFSIRGNEVEFQNISATGDSAALTASGRAGFDGLIALKGHVDRLPMRINGPKLSAGFEFSGRLGSDLSGTLAYASMKVNEVVLGSGRAEIVLGSDTLTILGSDLVMPYGRFSASGSLCSERLALTLTGTGLDIRAISGILGILGPVNGSLDLSGKIEISTYGSDQATASGRFTILGGNVSLSPYTPTIEALSGSVEITDDAISIENIVGVSGSGIIRMNGRIHGDDFQFSNVHLNLAGTGLRVSHPAVAGLFDGELTLAGDVSLPMLSGRVKMVRGLIDLDAITEQQAIALPDLPLNVIASTGENVRVDRRGLWLDVSRNSLRVSGTLHSPRVGGTIETKRGEIGIGSINFAVDEARVYVPDVEGMEPEVMIRASTRSGRGRITVTIEGKASSPRIILGSDSQLSPVEMAAAIIGYPMDSSDHPDFSGIRDAAVKLIETTLRLYLLSEVGRSLRPAISVDELRVEPGPDNRMLFRIGKRLKDNLYVAYLRTLDAAGKEALEFEYGLSDNLTVRTSMTDSGTYRLGIETRLRF